MKTNLQIAFVNGGAVGEIYEASGRWWWKRTHHAPFCFDAGVTIRDIEDRIERDFKMQPGCVHFIKTE